VSWSPGNAVPAPQGPQKPPLMQRLEWVKSLLELVLLLLAVPWIIVRLVREPRRGLRDLGEGHFG
jgi:hypothetical protein